MPVEQMRTAVIRNLWMYVVKESQYFFRTEASQDFIHDVHIVPTTSANRYQEPF